MKTFRKLDFKVDGYYFENITARDMQAQLTKVAELDHTNNDCFVCCISSHGSRDGVILGTDDDTVNIRDLTLPLRSSKCPSLAGKPKLFFIDACRGDKTQDGKRSTWHVCHSSLLDLGKREA